MNLMGLFLGIFLLYATLGVLDANKMCYLSKTCVHNGFEKCGVNSENKTRRFLDSCDILEYNCLKGTDYKKTSLEYCLSLPPIEGLKRSHPGLREGSDDDDEDSE